MKGEEEEERGERRESPSYGAAVASYSSWFMHAMEGADLEVASRSWFCWQPEDDAGSSCGNSVFLLKPEVLDAVGKALDKFIAWRIIWVMGNIFQVVLEVP